MEEESKETRKDKYIKCSKCSCKYNNDEDSLITNCGYTRLNERYKTCCKCRNKHKQYLNNNPDKKIYHIQCQQLLEVKEKEKNVKVKY